MSFLFTQESEDNLYLEVSLSNFNVKFTLLFKDSCKETNLQNSIVNKCNDQYISSAPLISAYSPFEKLVLSQYSLNAFEITNLLSKSLSFKTKYSIKASISSQPYRLFF